MAIVEIRLSISEPVHGAKSNKVRGLKYWRTNNVSVKPNNIEPRLIDIISFLKAGYDK